MLIILFTHNQTLDELLSGDYELNQLRKRLRETELAMERIVAQMGSVPLKSNKVSKIRSLLIPWLLFFLVGFFFSCFLWLCLHEFIKPTLRDRVSSTWLVADWRHIRALLSAVVNAMSALLAEVDQQREEDERLRNEQKQQVIILLRFCLS